MIKKFYDDDYRLDGITHLVYSDLKSTILFIHNYKYHNHHLKSHIYYDQ